MARRFRRLGMAAAGLAAALGLALPAAAAQAATADYTPSPAEWWMANWSVPQQVWPLTQGAGVTVAVVDSGVQASVPDLSGVVLRGTDLLGDSGNGDRDFLTSNDGHGTEVAEMIAGQGAAGGPVGLAPKAKILPIHVISGGSVGSPTDVAKGITYAVDHGASVINLSVATPFQSATYCDPGMQAAVSHALAHNVVVVAGSGDTDKAGGAGPQEPASCAGVLAVGGVEQTGALWKKSTRQPYVSVAAPADHILITGMDGRTGTVGSGTSYSSPLVAGAAALIRSKYPSMPWYQVDQRIIGTAIGVKPVPNDGYGYGIMDVAKAVNASQFPVPSSAPNPPYARYLAWLKSANGQIWAKQNGVTVPSSGSPGSHAGAAPSATAKSSSGSPVGLIIIVVIVILVLAGIVLALVRRSRSRSRSGRGPGGPGGPGASGAPGGGNPPNAYAPPPQQGGYPPGGPQQR